MNELTPKNETSKWFKAVLLLGMLLFAFYASTHMVAAGDTWVAMACGRHFSNHGVDTVEPFSFNSHEAGPSDEQLATFPEWSRGIIRKWHPTGWVNQNWLTHLGFYKLATWFGDGENYNFDTLVYWKFAIYFITVLLVYAVGKVLGAGDTLAAAAACLAMVVGRTFYDIRPAGYSNMLTPAFILILALAMCRNYRLIWLIVPLIVFWSNVHGGYIYTFIMLVPFIGINVLLRLPRRWAMCLGFIGLWAVLYLMSHKFITHEYYLSAQKALGHVPQDISLLNNKMFGVWVFLAVVSVALTVSKKLPSGLFNAYHLGAGGIYFLSLFIRFLPKNPTNLSPQFERIFSYFISSSLLSFIFVFVVGGLLICAMAFKQEVFISLPKKGIYHAIGASATALLAMIIFNPFHLTNLTHTFEISISKHAESWRQVNEWKPAFDFMDKTTSTPNPVGQEGWFGAMCVLTLVVFFAWLITYFLKPRTGKTATKKPDTEGTFEWPKIDLALIVISFLTIYMAIRSRRFIAIAGLAACPIIAMLIKEAFDLIPKKTNTILSWIASILTITWFCFWNLLILGLSKLTDKPATKNAILNWEMDWKTRCIVSLFILTVVIYLYLFHRREKLKHALSKMQILLSKNIFLCLTLAGIVLIWMFFWNNFAGYLYSISPKTWPADLRIDWQIRITVSLLVICIVTVLRFKKNVQLDILPVSLFILSILILCVSWGMKYKRIYLDPWPSDPKYNSVFMRMTASHLKPTEVGQFIKMNKISGRVFNYWTEGGAVSLGQEPDPESGKVPLKLFMDGRAQAAYNHDKFRLWQSIFSGGPVAQKIMVQKKKFSQKDFKEIGQWINNQLEEHEVWVVLMPSSQQTSTFMKALATTENWKTAYIDNVQHMLINSKTSQGEKLISQILQNKILFPSDYSKDLTTFRVITENQYTDRYNELYDSVKTEFDRFPFPLTVASLIRLRGFPTFKENVYRDITNYLDDFTQEKEALKKESGYLQRLATADICARFLAQERPKDSKRYVAQSREFRKETGTIRQHNVW